MGRASWAKEMIYGTKHDAAFKQSIMRDGAAMEEFLECPTVRDVLGPIKERVEAHFGSADSVMKTVKESLSTQGTVHSIAMGCYNKDDQSSVSTFHEVVAQQECNAIKGVLENKWKKMEKGHEIE